MISSTTTSADSSAFSVLVGSLWDHPFGAVEQATRARDALLAWFIGYIDRDRSRGLSLSPAPPRGGASRTGCSSGWQRIAPVTVRG
jgi:hypothetical protein